MKQQAKAATGPHTLMSPRNIHLTRAWSPVGERPSWERGVARSPQGRPSQKASAKVAVGHARPGGPSCSPRKTLRAPRDLCFIVWEAGLEALLELRLRPGQEGL